MSDAHSMTKANRAHTPADLHALARQSLERRDFKAAAASLGIAFELDPDDAEAMTIMADILDTQGDELEAVGYAILAVNTDAAHLGAKKKFLNLACNMSFTHHNPKIESALLRCLETPGLDCRDACQLWGQALLINPAFGTLFVEMTRPRGFLKRAHPLEAEGGIAPLLDPLFLAGLERMGDGYRPFDPLMTRLRLFLLEQTLAARAAIAYDDRLRLAAALARFMYQGNYIFDMTPKEERMTAELQSRIEQSEFKQAGAGDIADIAVLACFRPLHDLANAQDIIAAHGDHDAMGPLLRHMMARHTGNTP